MLFAAEHEPLGTTGLGPDCVDLRRSARTPKRWAWSIKLPVHPRAMLRAADKLIIAGTPLPAAGPLDPAELAACYEGKRGGRLLVLSAADGAKQFELQLPAPPVWDGLAAAYQRLFIAATDGRVVCLHQQGPSGPK
jgi:hypothetical protein